MNLRSLFVVLLCVMLLPIVAVTVLAQDDFVFGLVLVGPADDRGWSQSHFEGGSYVEAQMPNTRMLVFESLNPADSPETTLADVVELFVDEGAQIIFTTSDAFEEDTVAVAEQYPDVIFVNVSGDDVLTGEAPANVWQLHDAGRMAARHRRLCCCPQHEHRQVGLHRPVNQQRNAPPRRFDLLGRQVLLGEYARQRRGGPDV